MLAHQLRNEYGDGVGSYALYKWDYTYPTRTITVSDKPKYYVCSIFCMAMQVQLDFKDEFLGVDPLTDKQIYRKAFTYRELCEFLQVDERVSTPDARPRRTARCQVCGTSIKP